MKLSDFNITNQLHGRWCRFIIHRYLGQFLERNLELNQLSLNLTNGELLIEEVNINVHYVNELLTSLKVPLKLIDGFVGEIRIEVPWTQLLSNSTNLKIKDLQLTFQAKEVNIDENDIASMIGSVVDKLVSSQELARSFYEEETQSGEVMNESDGSDGIKSFTKVIDAIVARFCVDLADTTIRLENHATASSEMCTAIEFRAKTMQFMDEQMKNCRLDNRSAEVITSQPQGIGNITNLNKYVFLSGVELFTDVFSRIDEIPVNIGESSTSQVLTSMYIRREKLKQKSPTVSPHESLNADLFTSTMTSVSNFQSCHSQLPFNSTLNAQLDSLQVPRNENMLLSNPIKFAELAGDQCEIQIQIHNSDNNSESSDYKVNLNVDCKGMNIFISPSQIDIIKKFVNSISLPSAKASRAELGKKMEQKDFDVIVRHMEEITFQGNTAGRTNALGGGMGMGGWRNQENFGEFDNVSLDDTLNGNSDGSTGNPYVSLKDSSGRKEGTHLKIHFVRLNIVIPHEDIFSRERVETLPRKYHDAVNQLQNLAENFFKHCSQLKVQAHTPLHKVREQFDRLYPKNHLRFVGTSVIVKYDVEKLTGQEHMRFKLSVNNCDVLEYLTPESNPLEKNRCHYPIFDFSEFENTEHVEHLKVFYATSSGSSDEPQAQICIGDCRVELDLSIVDRLCDLLATKPFFDRTFSRNRLDSISRNQMHLSEDLFSPTTKKESSVQVRWKVLCNKLTLDLRVPIADLRNPKADRLPYRQRNVHSEFIRLCLKEIQIDIPIHDEMVKVGVACTELTGEFLGVSEEFEIRSEDLTFLYGAKLGNRVVRIDFEYDPRNKSLKTNTNIHLPAGADDMSRSYSAPILQHQSRREGPFSQVRRSFCPVNRSDSVSSLEQKEGELNEEIIQAGTREEMHEFADLSMKLSATAVKLDIPLLKVFLVNHDFLEVLYNRLVNDLALWQPAAPTLRGEDSDHQINAFEDKFHSLRQEKEDEEDEIIDDGQYSSEAVCYDRSKSHVFSFCLNVNSGSLLMGTKMKQNGLLFGSGQCVLNLTDTQLYTVAGYHGDMNRIFFHFTTNKLNIGHRNNTAYEKRGQISSNVFVKEFGKFAEDESQVQTIQPFEQFSKNEESDVLGIAIEMHTRPEANIKDLLLAIAVRNTTIKFKPFRDTGHLWVTQLVELFTLRDYEIPGYELPIVTTDLQLHLDNVVVAYDHKLINPSSNTRLRFVVGQTHVTSSIITNMDISKFTCIFEESQLWISNEKKTTPSVRFDREPRAKEDSFILVTEVGLLHLDVLHCLLPEDQLKDRKTPLVEIRCRNDVIAVWICADSLVTLVNMAIEISESDAFKSVPEEPHFTSEDDEEACGGDDTRSETGASIWSKPASMVKPSRDVLPVTVEQTLQAMIGSAIREKPHKPNEAISVGIDAVEEFSIDYSKNAREEGDSLEFESDRYRMHSLTTDEEFCMVDDGIIGTGITGADGAPTIKFIGKGQDPENVFEDSRHFRIPDEWRGDGLGALQESFPPPLLRYSIRDVSLHINIYGGSDLSRDDPKMKSYSVEEYRKGQGKGQKVLEATRGGPNRDHSVLVSVEINKISYLYQLFNKDATVMCTNLLSVYDIVVKDRLQLSNINELLYQYSNKEQPRRTCAPVLAIRIVESHQQEGRMMVSMLPIKINMDQDTMTFIQDFVEEVANAIKMPNEVVLATSTRPRIEVPAQVNNRRTSMEKPTTLNLEPLTPSPVQPPSPLGDLNYLLNKGNKSPHIDDITAAPLTASAVSIGNLFGTRTSMSNRTATPDDQSRSPDLNVTTSHLYPTEELEEEDEGLSENIFGEVEGDWRNTSEINFNDIVNQQPRTSTAVDDLLARSTMDGSFHPQYTEDCEALVDTSTDLSGEIDNETVCDDDDTEMAASQNQGDQPIRGNTFFKEFTFSPAASIFLDYQGKNRFSMEKGGAVLGVLCGIGQLNQAEIVLKEIHHRHGLLGIGRCLNHAANEWADDIKNNLPNVIASCGPISPIVQISKGFMDLFWMPVAEMRKEDGHVVKGLQRGVGSFGLSSAAGIVGIAQSFVGVLQSVAETVLHEVQPDSACLNRRNRRVAGRSGAPTDLRHGIQLAYGIMSDGVRQTKEDYELAAQEERASGQSGVRSILRFATPAVLRPLVMGTQMSYQLLGGLRNQLRPDMYQDERHKWRDDEVPGGSRS